MMHRALRHMVLFAVLALVQVLLLDNLRLGVDFAPLVYVGFVLLLPLEMPRVGVLICALIMGVTMDAAMGAAGVNTIATLPVAMARLPLLRLLSDKEVDREGGIPSVQRLGRGLFWRYLVLMVVAHHFIFFTVEALSWAQMGHVILRTAISSAASVLFLWPMCRLMSLQQK